VLDAPPGLLFRREGLNALGRRTEALVIKYSHK
jgi:hypothetical protein